MQRREHTRYNLWFPVQVEAGGAPTLAMNQNIGAGGMLIAFCTQMKVGEPVSMTFRVPTSPDDLTVRGHVTRIEPNTADPDGVWPYKVGVAFEEVAPDLIPYLEEAVARFG